MSSTPGPTMEFLGRVTYEVLQMKPLVPTYIHLLMSAIFPIYTAAHASLARPSSAAPATKEVNADLTEVQDEEISPTIEALSPSDAILFPVLAGCTLASLYFILKWLQDPALLNYYLGLYFAVVGLFFLIKFIKDGLATIRSMTLPNQYSYQGKVWKLALDKNRFTVADNDQTNHCSISPLPGIFSSLFQHRNSAIWSLRKFLYTRLRLKFSIWKLINIITVIDALDLAALAIAIPLVGYHTFIDKPWFLTNILGFSFCYGSLQMTTPGTSWTGTMLLCALFFYDIYFVFFTPMMVTVATKLDIPIKLLFPRPDGCVKPVGASTGSKAMEEYVTCLAKKRTMAMLGLGDIVIPGMMLAFALRFDLYLHYRNFTTKNDKIANDDRKNSKKTKYLPATGLWGERFWTSTKLHSPELKAKQFSKTYFNASVVGYILGMIATVIVMQISQHAQPALLYLVPGVLISLWGVALVQGDFTALWNYSEIPEEEKTDDKNKKDVTEKKDKDATAGQKQLGNQETDKSRDQSDAAENGTAEPNITTETNMDTVRAKVTKSNTGNTDDVSNKQKISRNTTDDQLILFSLCIIHPSTQKKSNSKPKTRTAPNQIHSGQSPPSDIGLRDANDISNDGGEAKAEPGFEEADVEAVMKAFEQKTSHSHGRDENYDVEHAATTGTGDADGEPAVKRRRKV